jgi:hypothetical protein
MVSMPELPGNILLPITKSEALLILDALSNRHLHLKQHPLPDDRVDAYNDLITKICKELGDDSGRPYLVKD